MSGGPVSAAEAGRRPSAVRIQYFEVLRAIAIVAVVMIHAAITEWHALPVDDPRWDDLTWINGALRFCVPIFFMISGALFLAPEKTVTSRSLFRRSIPRLLAAFAIWSLLYALLEVYGPDGSRSFPELLTRTVTGHFHLWFLLALTGLYLAVPILRVIAREPRVAWYFVALALPFASVFPVLERAPVVGEVLGRVLGDMRFDLVLGYSAYFLLGHLLSRARLTRGRLTALAAAGVAGAVGTGVGTLLVSRAAGEWDELFFGFLTPGVAAVSIAVFCLARAWGEASALHGAGERAVRFLAANSFGIYLVHPLFQWLYARLGFTTEVAPPIVSVPALTAAVLLPSAFVAAGLRRIPRAGRYLA